MFGVLRPGSSQRLEAVGDSFYPFTGVGTRDGVSLSLPLYSCTHILTGRFEESVLPVETNLCLRMADPDFPDVLFEGSEEGLWIREFGGSSHPTSVFLPLPSSIIPSEPGRV